MILDTTINHYKYTETRNAEGMLVKAWSIYSACLSVNVQPVGLRPALLIEHGIDLRNSDAKLMFAEKETASTILIGDMIEHGSNKYLVQAKNEWPVHCEYTLLPIQGGQ